MSFQLLELAKEAAREAGEYLTSRYSVDTVVQSDQGKDIKTEADIASEEIIISKLSITNIPIVSEEQFSPQASKTFNLNNTQWIIDPLDGTLNYTRGLPIASVSVALWEQGKPVLGVLYDLESLSTWSAYVGHGAFLNSNLISTSDVAQIDQAIIASGFPTGSTFDLVQLQTIQRYVHSFKKIRMLGCASLMLAQVAAGRFDAYEENNIYIWDVAAGLALVSAAGGHYQLQPGLTSVQFKVTATNGHLNFP